MLSKKVEKEILDDLRFFLKQRIISIKTTQSYLKKGSSSYDHNQHYIDEYKGALSAVDEFQQARNAFRQERGLK